MKKLLATTSILALAASPAFATLMLTPGATLGAGEISDNVELAEEADLSGAALDAIYGLDVSTVGTIPPAQNLFITVTVSGGTFTSALTGGEWFDGVSTAIVDSGGAKGDSSVRYLITTDPGLTAGGPQSDVVSVNLPVSYAGCPSDVTFAVTEFETEGPGTAVEGGTATLDNGNVAPDNPDYYVTCVDAITATLIDDGGPGGSDVDSVLDFTVTPSLSDFVLAGVDSATNARIGDFELEVDTTADSDLAGTGVVLGDVTGFEATLNFPNGVEDAGMVDAILNCDVNPTAGTIFDTGGVVALGADEDCDLAVALAPTATPATGVLEVNVTGANAVPTQQPTVAGAVITLGAGFISEDPFLEAATDDLDPNSLNIGPFDWVGDNTKGTRNIFRLTGTGATLPAQIDAEITNTTSGTSVTCTIDLTGKNPEEIIINANDLTNSGCGTWGRGDVTFKIFDDLVNDDSLDMDRLMATGGDNIVSTFGNDEEDNSDTSDGDDD